MSIPHPTPDSLAGALLTRARRFTGFQPTGRLHLGNLLGAITPAIESQDTTDTIFSIVDLHALTVNHDPAALRERTRELAAILLAAGLDTDRSPLYAQSQLPAHTGMHYLLESATSYGEAHRMIQFKEKSGNQDFVRLSLLTYPILMAADILLFDTEEVPVGQDQRQHVELARDIAVRVNGGYGPVFTVPRAVHPAATARVMDLANPKRKMSKSTPGAAGTIFVLDPPEVIATKFSRAVTDSSRTVRYDPIAQPGVANLLAILAGATTTEPDRIADQYTTYGALKSATTEAVIALLGPIQRRYAEITADPGYLDAVLTSGRNAVADRANATLNRARIAFGLAANAS